VSILQALRAASGRTSQLVTIAGPGAVETANTVAGTKDGSDASADAVLGVGDDVGGVPGAGALSFGYLLEPATTAVPIAFARVNLRARVSSGSGTVGPAVDLTEVDNRALTGDWVLYSFDLATDPATGLAWTPPSVNLTRWGGRLSVLSASPLAGGTAEVSEFEVELHDDDSPLGVRVTGTLGGRGEGETGPVTAAGAGVSAGAGALEGPVSASDAAGGAAGSGTLEEA